MHAFLLLIGQTFFLLLPAYLANIAAAVVGRLAWFKFLGRPIDFNQRLWGQPLFGQNKTWRGLIVGVIVGALVAAGQKLAIDWWPAIKQISLVDFTQTNFLLFGALAGAGALIGDLIKSFFKRRLAIAPGQPWPIFDQLDLVFGFFILTAPLLHCEIKIIIAACLLTMILHPLANLIGYCLKIKKVWW